MRYQHGEIVEDRDGTLLVYDARDGQFYEATNADIEAWKRRNSVPRPTISISGRRDAISRVDRIERIERVGTTRRDSRTTMGIEREENSAAALNISRSSLSRDKEETVEREVSVELPNIAREIRSAPLADTGEVIYASYDTIIDLAPKSFTKLKWVNIINIEVPEDIDIRALKHIIPDKNLVIDKVPHFLEKALIDIFNRHFSVKIKDNLPESLSKLKDIYFENEEFQGALTKMVSYLDTIGRDKLNKGDTIKEKIEYDLVVLPLALAKNVLDYPMPIKGMEVKQIFKNIKDKVGLDNFMLIIGNVLFEIKDDMVRIKYAD